MGTRLGARLGDGGSQSCERGRGIVGPRQFVAPGDAPATPAQKTQLSKLSPASVSASELAGERIVNLTTTAPGNGAALGGLKVETENGWFAARPSGTENVYKLYAESFVGEEHLHRIQAEAQAIIQRAFDAHG